MKEKQPLASALGDTTNHGMPKGLYKKYHVTYSDGTPLPEGSVAFVMLVDKDPAARVAVEAYAGATRNEELARDLYQILSAIYFQLSRQASSTCRWQYSQTIQGYEASCGYYQPTPDGAEPLSVAVKYCPNCGKEVTSGEAQKVVQE